MPQKVAQLLAATTRNRAVHRGPRPVSAARVERPAADSRGARRRRARARAAAPAGAGRVPRFDRRVARRIRRAPGSFPLLEAATSAAPRRSRAKPRQVREKIDPSGDVVDDASPELKRIRERLRKQRIAAAQHARVVPARQGHREVPAGSGRHRAQRPLRAGRQGRASQRDSRASCTARRPAAPACSSSRSARSRSTTTSSRSKSRRPRKSAASCSR